jgi:hypothetical protein
VQPLQRRYAIIRPSSIAMISARSADIHCLHRQEGTTASGLQGAGW